MGFAEEKEQMYLDTDIILALIKEEDWLKKYVHFSQLQCPQTSVFTIVEARIVLLREYSRKEALSVLPQIKKLNVQLLPLEQQIIEKSQELLATYPQLNIFDAVHAASAMIHNEIIVSTDSVYQKIVGLKRKDPRDFTV